LIAALDLLGRGLGEENPSKSLEMNATEGRLEMTHSELLSQHQGLRELAALIIKDADAPYASQRAVAGVSPMLIGALREELGEGKSAGRD
jgi:hypothetical protein